MNTNAATPLIAIVDDDESVREAISSLLRAAGYRTALFDSGEALLSRDQKHEMSCLILDIQMRGLSGLDVHRQLAETNVSIPTVFVTAADRLCVPALALRAIAALSKPFSDEALFSAVESALKRTQSAPDQA
jgi:FixJ family two-component response regulator